MEKMIALNLQTPMRLCHHLSKPMVEDRKGVIIDIASIVRHLHASRRCPNPCTLPSCSWLLPVCKL